MFPRPRPVTIRRIVALLAVLSLGAAVPAGAADGPAERWEQGTPRIADVSAASVPPGRLTVHVDPGVPLDAILRYAEARGWTSTPMPRGVPMVVVETGDARAATEAAGALSAVPGVSGVTVPQPVSAAAMDPGFRYQQGLSHVRTPELWRHGVGHASTVIAVLDTGLDLAHPEFSGRVMQGFDFVNMRSEPWDDNGHGTAVAGLAAARGDNGFGTAGVCWRCSVLPVKVLDRNGSGDSSTVAAGVYFAVDSGADVIVLSLGSTSDGTGALTDPLAFAVEYAESFGVTVVAAAGNQGRASPPTYPAAYPTVVGVSGTDLRDVRAPESNYGEWVDVAAPFCYATTAPGDGLGSAAYYSSFCGTSASAPVVAGIAATLRSLGGSPTVVRDAVRRSGVTTSAAPTRVDALDALLHVRSRRGTTVSLPASAVAVRGDWNGDGIDTPGWFHDGTWYLRNSPSPGPANTVLRYGQAGDKPVAGDWDGDGVDTVGVVRGNLWILRNEYKRDADDIKMYYGRSTDKPVAGDWDGDGVDTLGVVRGNLWILRSVYKRGADDVVMRYGEATDKPVTGDWDGDGDDTLGVVRGNLFILRSVYKRDADDVVMTYGVSSDRPMVGDWHGDGRDTLGVVRGDLWVLRSAYSRPYLDRVFSHG